MTLTLRSWSNYHTAAIWFLLQAFQIIKPGVWWYLIKWLRYHYLWENDIGLNFKVIASTCRTFFYKSFKALPCHTRIYKIILNLLRIDWAMLLWKGSHFPIWPTFWGHVMTLRDEFYIILNVFSRANFGPKIMFLARQDQIVTHVHTRTHTLWR